MELSREIHFALGKNKYWKIFHMSPCNYYIYLYAIQCVVMWPKVLRLCTLLCTYALKYGHKIIFVHVPSTVSFPAAVIRIRSYYANEDSSHLMHSFDRPNQFHCFQEAKANICYFLSCSCCMLLLQRWAETGFTFFLSVCRILILNSVKRVN